MFVDINHFGQSFFLGGGGVVCLFFALLFNEPRPCSYCDTLQYVAISLLLEKSLMNAILFMFIVKPKLGIVVAD
jgi:hypothetical protein